jgi:predicted MFS family arabinose efflux permease
VPHPYLRLLADRRLRRLAAGDLLSLVGDGMAVVAIPWEALHLAHLRGVSEGLAVSASASAYVLVGVPLALTTGLGRYRPDPRRALLADCALRGTVFVLIGALAATSRLGLWGLVGLLAAGSVLHPLALSSRRLIATDLAGPQQRLAVNSLLVTQLSLATWTIGPALGGMVTATLGAAGALALDGASFLPLLLATLILPAHVGRHGTEPRRRGQRSGLTALRSRPGVVGLLALTLAVDLLYYPVEVAPPIHVRQTLGGAQVLGAIWAGFGVGAIAGSLLAGLLGRLPQRYVLVGNIAGWALALAGFPASSRVPRALMAFTVGGVMWAPFIPVVYTLVQGEVTPDEQQPVLTIWTAIVVAAAPLGLLLAGTLVSALGAAGTLWASAAATLVLGAIALVILIVAGGAGGGRRIARPPTTDPPAMPSTRSTSRTTQADRHRVTPSGPAGCLGPWRPQSA